MLLYNYKIEMVQEVQQQWNWYQTPNRIEWIWVSERKVSDHTQVRNKRTNWCEASTRLSLTNASEVKSSSRTVTSDDKVKYRAIWGKIYIPLPWTYLVKFQVISNYASTNSYKFRIYSWKREIYLFDGSTSDKTIHEILLDLGRKNDLSVSLYMTGIPSGNTYYIDVKMQFIKL